MSDTKYRKDQEKIQAKIRDKLVNKVEQLRKDNRVWKKKKGINNKDIKNQTISKKPEFCETKIEHVCWNVYEKKLREDGYCVTRNCKRCKEALMKSRKCEYGNKKKLVEYPPLRF